MYGAGGTGHQDKARACTAHALSMETWLGHRLGWGITGHGHATADGSVITAISSTRVMRCVVGPSQSAMHILHRGPLIVHLRATSRYKPKRGTVGRNEIREAVQDALHLVPHHNPGAIPNPPRTLRHKCCTLCPTPDSPSHVRPHNTTQHSTTQHNTAQYSAPKDNTRQHKSWLHRLLFRCATAAHQHIRCTA